MSFRRRIRSGERTDTGVSWATPPQHTDHAHGARVTPDGRIESAFAHVPLGRPEQPHSGMPHPSSTDPSTSSQPDLRFSLSEVADLLFITGHGIRANAPYEHQPAALPRGTAASPANAHGQIITLPAGVVPASARPDSMPHVGQESSGRRRIYGYIGAGVLAMVAVTGGAYASSEQVRETVRTTIENITGSETAPSAADVSGTGLPSTLEQPNPSEALSGFSLEAQPIAASAIGQETDINGEKAPRIALPVDVRIPMPGDTQAVKFSGDTIRLVMDNPVVAWLLTVDASALFVAPNPEQTGRYIAEVDPDKIELALSVREVDALTTRMNWFVFDAAGNQASLTDSLGGSVSVNEVMAALLPDTTPTERDTILNKLADTLGSDDVGKTAANTMILDTAASLLRDPAYVEELNSQINQALRDSLEAYQRESGTDYKVDLRPYELDPNKVLAFNSRIFPVGETPPNISVGTTSGVVPNPPKSVKGGA